MKMKILILIGLSSILFCACACSFINDTLLGADDELSISKKTYLGKELRTDGYYLKETNDKYSNAYFFYKNGVVLSGNAIKNTSEKIKEKEEEYTDGTYYSYVKKDKINWGLFEIEGSIIRFERWYPGSGGPLSAYIREGTILNDTIFKITQSYRMQNEKKTEIRSKDELYYFKALNPKPDSTNVFVP